LLIRSLTISKPEWQNETSMANQKGKEASLKQEITQKAGAVINLEETHRILKKQLN